MFGKSVTILVAVWCLQVCSATHYITNYTTCVDNYDVAISNYKAFWAKFEKAREDSRNKALEAISRALAKMSLTAECLKAFPNQTAEFYNKRMFKACGGITEDMRLYQLQILDTKEKTCGRLVTYSPELLALKEHNEKVQKTCNFRKAFEKHYGRNLNACQSNV